MTDGLLECSLYIFTKECFRVIVNLGTKKKKINSTRQDDIRTEFLGRRNRPPLLQNTSTELHRQPTEATFQN